MLSIISASTISAIICSNNLSSSKAFDSYYHNQDKYATMRPIDHYSPFSCDEPQPPEFSGSFSNNINDFIPPEKDSSTNRTVQEPSIFDFFGKMRFLTEEEQVEYSAMCAKDPTYTGGNFWD